MARFFRRGTSRIYFLPAVASAAAPTGTEITNGVRIDVDMATMTGWAFTNAPIATPDMSSTFTTTIPGEDTVQNPSIEFYDQDNATTIRAALAKGTAGFVLLCPYGITTGKRAEVWPAKSTGVNDTYTVASDTAKFTAQFAITATPTQAAVLP